MAYAMKTCVCRQCGTEIEVDREMEGMKVECPKCSSEFEISVARVASGRQWRRTALILCMTAMVLVAALVVSLIVWSSGDAPKVRNGAAGTAETGSTNSFDQAVPVKRDAGIDTRLSPSPPGNEREAFEKAIAPVIDRALRDRELYGPRQ